MLVTMSHYSLSKLKFTSAYFSAIDCVLNGNKAIYCSSEITSGLRLYTAMRKHGAKSGPELRRTLGDAWYQKNILDANIKSANLFADSVRRGQADGTLVITPAPLEIPDWGQSEYLAFWEELIRTRVKAVRFNKDWEFSNGCTFEFVVASEAGVSTLDADGEPFGLGAGLAAIEAAIDDLEHDFDTPKLRDNLQSLRSLGAPPPMQGTDHNLSPGNGKGL